MKFLHLSDLHLGKKVNEFSMLEDQKYILNQIIETIKIEKPDGVIIAGDVYDKTVPDIGAINLLDSFLTELAKLQVSVYLISGNHDNSERLSFGSDLFKLANVHIAQSYNGFVECIKTFDEFGEIYIYLLPYIKPSLARACYPSVKIENFNDALKAVLDDTEVNTNKRNVIVAHQFITGGETSDSEELYVGGIENVSSTIFDDFDYVALGHLHAPQSVSRESLRYGGSPLKYSISEKNQRKYLTFIDLKEKGDVSISKIDLKPLRDFREIRGTYKEVMSKEFYEGTNTDDYIHIILTDEIDEVNALGKLRTVYPNLIKLEYDNQRTRAMGNVSFIENANLKTPFELISELYEKQNGIKMSDEQIDFVNNLFDQIKSGEIR